LWGFLVTTLLAVITALITDYDLNWQQFRSFSLWNTLNPLQKIIHASKEPFEKKENFVFYGNINNSALIMWTVGLQHPANYGQRPLLWVVPTKSSHLLRIPLVSRFLRWSGAIKITELDDLYELLNRKFSIFTKMRDPLLTHLYERKSIALVPIHVNIERGELYIGMPIHPERYDNVEDLKLTVNANLEGLINTNSG